MKRESERNEHEYGTFQKYVQADVPGKLSKQHKAKDTEESKCTNNNPSSKHDGGGD
jgi:hypothetical protein